jgi:hypothetical protein
VLVAKSLAQAEVVLDQLCCVKEAVSLRILDQTLVLRAPRRVGEFDDSAAVGRAERRLVRRKGLGAFRLDREEVASFDKAVERR